MGVIVYFVSDYVAQQTDSIFYDLFGKVHRDNIVVCENSREAFDRISCLNAANSAYNTTLILISVLLGLPSGYVISLILNAVGALD